MLAFNHEAGLVLVADLGATHARVAITDLAGGPLAEPAEDLDIALGPDRGAKWVSARFEKLLGRPGTARPTSADRDRSPGPVEFATGRPVNPPIMPGWDGFDIPGWFAEH